jgi:hypothetical protein
MRNPVRAAVSIYSNSENAIAGDASGLAQKLKSGEARPVEPSDLAEEHFADKPSHYE